MDDDFGCKTRDVIPPASVREVGNEKFTHTVTRTAYEAAYATNPG